MLYRVGLVSKSLWVVHKPISCTAPFLSADMMAAQRAQLSGMMGKREFSTYSQFQTNQWLML